MFHVSANNVGELKSSVFWVCQTHAEIVERLKWIDRSCDEDFTATISTEFMTAILRLRTRIWKSAYIDDICSFISEKELIKKSNDFDYFFQKYLNNGEIKGYIISDVQQSLFKQCFFHRKNLGVGLVTSTLLRNATIQRADGMNLQWCLFPDLIGTKMLTVTSKSLSLKKFGYAVDSTMREALESFDPKGAWYKESETGYMFSARIMPDDYTSKDCFAIYREAADKRVMVVCDAGRLTVKIK